MVQFRPKMKKAAEVSICLYRAFQVLAYLSWLVKVSGCGRHFRGSRPLLAVAATDTARPLELIAVGTELSFHRRHDALTQISQTLFAGVEQVASFVQRCDVAVVGVLLVDEPFDLCRVSLNAEAFAEAYPGFAALTPGFMPSSAPRTSRSHRFPIYPGEAVIDRSAFTSFITSSAEV